MPYKDVAIGDITLQWWVRKLQLEQGLPFESIALPKGVETWVTTAQNTYLNIAIYFLPS